MIDYLRRLRYRFKVWRRNRALKANRRTIDAAYVKAWRQLEEREEEHGD